jgi:hypothetical protein
MSDQTGDEVWRPPESVDSPNYGAVPATPDPSMLLSAPPVQPPVPGSILPPPPARPVPTMLVDGAVQASPPRGPRWIGRTLALGAAVALIGGGGYLAINAGATEGGAATPQAALEGVLESLSSEDLVGAAEFVEPTERETMIDAGFDVIEELIRLEVFSEDLDLRSIGGVDLAFSDLEIDMTEVRPGLAQLFLDGGRVSATVNGAEFPFGPLITERVDAETLAVVESNSTRIEPTDYPIVAVQRDGRWYLSLWYSVAENARIVLDQPLPDRGERPVAIGGDSPESAIELFVGAVSGVDLGSMIGMLDPEEAAALYDYAPLFLDDAQSEVDERLAEARRDGWQWEVSDLQLSSESDGRLATVVIDAFAFEASGPGTTVEVVYSGDRSRIWFETDGQTVEIVADGDCVTTVIDDGFGLQTDEFCASDLADVTGFEALTGGVFANLQSLSTPGIVVREVDGRWYVSPLRTGSTVMLDVLRSIEPEALAETVDGVVGFFDDPFAFGPGGFGSSPFGLSGPGFGPGEGLFTDDLGTDFPTPSTVVPDEPDYPELRDVDESILSSELETYSPFQLWSTMRDELWLSWLTADTDRRFSGVIAQIRLSDDSLGDIMVVTDVMFPSDEALLERVGGRLMVEGDFAYVLAFTVEGARFVVTRSDEQIIAIGSRGAALGPMLEALRTQAGR